MSNSLFIAKLNEVNLCTRYILPWLGIDLWQHNAAIGNSYLIKDDMVIAVYTPDLNLCRDLLNNPNFLCMVEKEGKDLLCFQIPDSWAGDYEHFLKGQYSRMSEEAKEMIRAYSGLSYATKDAEGYTITDAILLALDRHPKLKQRWAEELGVPMTQLPHELLSPPGPQTFIDLPTSQA